MNHFLVNGIEKSSPIEADQRFGDLMEYVHQNLTNDQSLISEIRVNGIEISEEEERSLSGIFLSEIDSIEVILSHPKELAEETLRTLQAYLGRLVELSQRIAGSIRGRSENPAEFQKLLDGIETLSDTIFTVRTLYRVGIMPTLNLLEADLASIMRDLLDARQADQDDYRIQLLEDHLPDNLNRWAVQAIPELMRSRDS